MESAAVFPVAGQNSSNIGQIFEIVCNISKFYLFIIQHLMEHLMMFSFHSTWVGKHWSKHSPHSTAKIRSL